MLRPSESTRTAFRCLEAGATKKLSLRWGFFSDSICAILSVLMREGTSYVVVSPVHPSKDFCILALHIRKLDAYYQHLLTVETVEEQQ